MLWLKSVELRVVREVWSFDEVFLSIEFRLMNDIFGSFSFWLILNFYLDSSIFKLNQSIRAKL